MSASIGAGRNSADPSRALSQAHGVLLPHKETGAAFTARRHLDGESTELNRGDNFAHGHHLTLISALKSINQRKGKAGSYFK